MKRSIRILAAALAAVLCLGAAAYGAEAAGTAAGTGAPVAQNLELQTYRGVSVGGRFAAVDPEGEALTFEIMTEPNKGVVEVGDNGRFVYTPKDGKRGKDYFGYCAIDASGERSQEATVIISIMKQKTKLTYSDMGGDGAEFAAVHLAEKGVYTGANVGGQYVFSGGEPVTRGEFLAMCMRVAGESILSGVARTGFFDDDSIPVWVKPYVSTALMGGMVTGYVSEDGRAVFDSQKALSYCEAAVMLSGILGLSDVAAGDAASPAWAAQASANLSASGITDAVAVADPEAVTRAEAAVMLSAALSLR